MSEENNMALIAALAEPFDECATALSRKLEDAQCFWSQSASFHHSVSDLDACLCVRKESGGWELAISVPPDGCPVPATSAPVHMKFHAVQLLPGLYASYAKEMQRRVTEMERLLYPNGRPIAAAEPAGEGG